jgi:hypothetical protein
VLLGLLAVAALTGLAERAVFFSISCDVLPPTTDESSNHLLARAVADGERPLLFLGQPYQFPLEAYLLAPLAPHLPPRPVATRAVLALLQVLATALLVAALIRGAACGGDAVPPAHPGDAVPPTLPDDAVPPAPPGASLNLCWPGVLLVLIPSSYWLTVQSAYFIPQYTVFMLGAALTFWLVARAGSGRLPSLVVFAAGLAGGLLYSAHVLSLVYTLPAAAAIALGHRPREAAVRLPLYVAGLTVGLVPYIAGVLLIPGAHVTMQDTRLWSEALRLLWNPTIVNTLPGALGFPPPEVPDFGPRLPFGASLAAAVGIAVALLLLVGTAARAAAFVRRLLRDRWPSLTLVDVALGTCWLSVALFSLSRRSYPDAVRYLLAAVAALPFIIAHLHARSPRLIRVALAALVVLWAGFNLASSTSLMRVWREPGFAASIAGTPPLDPLLAALDDRGTDRVYATFWLAYRLPFETEGRVVASQPYNERFYRWPLPYLEEVDATPAPVPYVMLLAGEKKILQLERDLALAGATAEVTNVDGFRIYDRFHYPRAGREHPAALPGLRVSDAPGAHPVAPLVDADRTTEWMSDEEQKRGMSLTLDWAGQYAIAGVRVHYERSSRIAPAATRLLVRTRDGWSEVARLDRSDVERMEWRNGQPRYGVRLQTLRCEPVETDAIRIEIVEPRSARRWYVSEVEPLALDPPSPEAATDRGP